MANKKTTRRTKKASLPPQKHLNAPLYKSGGVNKPLVVTIITVVALAILSLFLLFSQQFAGKAFYTNFGEAGAEIYSGEQSVTSVNPNTPVDLWIGAYLSQGSTTAAGFKLQLPTEISCNSLTIQNIITYGTLNYLVPASFPGLVSKVFECKTDETGSYVVFDYSTINSEYKLSPATDGILRLGVIKLTNGLPNTGSSSKTYSFHFDYFNVIDFETTNELVTNVNNISLVVNSAVSPQEPATQVTEVCTGEVDEDLDNFVDCADSDCTSAAECTAQPKVCGDGIKEAGEECDDGNAVDGDSCTSYCLIDTDKDGVSDSKDNCPTVWNVYQEDADKDGTGDICEITNPPADSDNDGVIDTLDQCIATAASVSVDTNGCALLPPPTEFAIQLLDLRGQPAVSYTKGAAYQISINLPAGAQNYLVLSKVEYGNKLATQYADFRKGSGEDNRVVFTHLVPSDAGGVMKVTAYLWNNWLSLGTAWTQITDSATATYNENQ